MEIDTIAEWDAICRICLQEGQLHSLFDFDEEKSDLNIAEKIMLCSPIVVRLLAVCNQLHLIQLPAHSYLFVFSLLFLKLFACLDNNRWQTSRANLHKLLVRFGCGISVSQEL